MTQHDFSALGVHPTCSVSMISSGPAAPEDPSDLTQYARTQYVIPGSKSVASPSGPDTVVLLAPAAQSSSICFHSSLYLAIDDTGLNLTEIVVSVASINSSFGPVGTDMAAILLLIQNLNFK